MTFTYDWFSGREFQLNQWLFRFKGKPVEALEVGCFEGRSTVWFMENVLTHPDAVLTCIDSFQGSLEHTGIDFNKVSDNFCANVRPYGFHVQLLVGHSREVLPKLAPNSFDFAYVDGSHQADDVYTDSLVVWPLLKQDGLLIFDDYLWDGHINTPQYTRLGIDRFLAATPHVMEPSYQLAIRKP